MLARRDADVAARVRVVLSAPRRGQHGGEPPPGRPGAAVRRARRDRRRVLVPALVVLAVVVGAVAVPRTGTGPAVATAGSRGLAEPPADPLVAASVLDLDQVSALLPGASGRAPAADVTPLTAAGYPPPRYLGGWCGDAVLLDAPSPQQVWAAEWEQQGLAGTTATRGPAGAVREVVLRWPDAPGARAWAQATHASPTRCRDPRGAPFPLTAFRVWTMVTTATTTTSVAVAPAVARPGGAGPADAAGPSGEPVWRVRAVASRGATVVDLTAVVRAPEAKEAAGSVSALLEVAADRAGQGERGGAR